MKTFKYLLFCFLTGAIIVLLTFLIQRFFLEELNLIKLFNIYFYEGSLLFLAGMILQLSASKNLTFERTLLKYYPVKTRDISNKESGREVGAVSTGWTLIIIGISIYIILLILHLTLKPLR